MLKAAIKHSSGEDQVRHRQIPPEVVSKWSQKLDSLKGEISEILQEEKEEKQVCSDGYFYPPHLDGHLCAVDRFVKLRWS